MDKNWIYYGVFFSDKTKETILKYTKRWLQANDYYIPDNWKIYCDHMTLVYNDKSEEKQKIAETLETFIGNKCSLRVVSVGVSDRAIALGIDFITQNKNSHVTVAIAPDAKPVESNKITNWYKTDGNFYITGIYDKVSKR